jgi:hypothetical protein
MATAANQKVPAGGTDLKDVAALVGLLGGQRGTTTTSATSNAGDTAALQAALSQLQGADYNAMLQSIFQQAGAQIPGMQAAYGRSVGARSYNNSAVQAALGELLKATTVAAQDQMARQQLANQQTQVQAGQAIAQATKGTQTTQSQTQKSGLDLQRAAALLALWQGVGQLTSGKKPSDMFGGLFKGGGTVTSAPAAPTVTAPAATASVTSAPMAAPAAAAALPSVSFDLPSILTNPIRALGNLIAYGSFDRPIMPGSTPVPASEMFSGIQPSTPESLGFSEPVQRNLVLDFNSALRDAMAPMPAASYTPVDLSLFDDNFGM